MSITIRAIILLNISTALVPAVLITIDLPYFEPAAHNIEYVNTIILTMINAYLLFGYAKGRLSQFNQAFVVIGLIAGVLQLVLYNALGDPKGELWGHWVEFPLEIVSAAIAFHFAMETKATADAQAASYMYALHAPNDGYAAM